MIGSQYLRIERKAGGKGASCRAFIKSCHTVLSDKGKTRNMRDIRHQWIREGLKMFMSKPF